MARHGDLVFGHRFEQGALRFGWRAIDFVGQDELGKDRAGHELQMSPARGGVFLNEFRAENVRGHEVGRELNAFERQAHRSRQGAHEQRLGQPRHAHQQHVSLAQQGEQERFNSLLLADDHPAERGPQGVATLLDRVEFRQFLIGARFCHVVRIRRRARGTQSRCLAGGEYF